MSFSVLIIQSWANHCETQGGGVLLGEWHEEGEGRTPRKLPIGSINAQVLTAVTGGPGGPRGGTVRPRAPSPWDAEPRGSFFLQLTTEELEY